jgi:hypothetical protein
VIDWVIGWYLLEYRVIFSRKSFPSHKLNLALLAVLLLAALGYFLQTSLAITNGRLGVPLDDSWIHYQFARNLASGSGFSYNPGQPTPGSTAPLWTLILAGVGLFTSDFLVPSLVLSAFFLLAAVWLAYGLTLDLVGDDGRLWPLLAGLAVLFTGRLLWAGLAGMETTAFAALSLAAVWSYHRQGMRPLPALLFALTGQLRPEGHALFALAVADTVLPPGLPGSWKPAQFDKRSLLLSVLIYAAVTAPYVLFSLSTTGRPLPNTFYAKAGTEHLFSFRALKETLAYHWQDNPVAFILIPVGLFAHARRKRLFVAWLVGLPILTAVIIDTIWHHGRYTLPLIPFQMIAAVLGARWLVQWLLKRPFLQPQRGLWAKGLVFIAALLIIGGGVMGLPAWAGMLGQNSKEILEIDVALGHWLAENTPPDALIAVDDIGAIAFISERPIFDLIGLVSPEMWPINREEAEGRPRNEATARLLSTIKPDYLAIFPTWHWELATNPVTAEPVQRFWTESLTMIGNQEAIVYRATWPYLEQATPQTDRVVQLGDGIQLIGYDLTSPSSVGEPLLLTLYWESLEPVSEGYDIFVHVVDENGQIVAQADQEPVASLAPTHRWQPGDIIRDPYEIFLPADLPAGLYHLNFGMYLKATGVRLPSSDPEAVDNITPLTSFS